MVEKAKRQAELLRETADLLDKESMAYFPSENFHSVADLLEELARQLESAQPKWISVEERLPEFERRVLVADGHGKVFILAFWRKAENKWSWVDESGHFKHYNNITHWMPLPEPPKEET